jgi:hypothetical protein
MLVATQVEIVTVYEVHCGICGQAVESGVGGFQFRTHADALEARREHVREHKEEGL